MGRIAAGSNREDILTPAQYEQRSLFHVPQSSERGVGMLISFQDKEEPVYLPIDS